jgi:hypothetical protein
MVLTASRILVENIMKKIVEIKDKNGRAFRMRLIVPTSETWAIKTVQIWKQSLNLAGWLDGSISGKWEAIDQGFIRPRSGNTQTRFTSNKDLTTSDLLILGMGGIKTYDKKYMFGMQLFRYEHILGTNSEGEGTVIQAWVVGLTPGRINWKIIERFQ